MNKKKIFPTMFGLIIIIALIFNGAGNAVPEMNDVILYMVSEKGETHTIGDIVNVTVVFKNYLATNQSLANVTIQFTAPPELNITSVNNISANMTSYNYTEIVSHVNLTTPTFWWNSTLVNATWPKYEQYQIYMFWYTFNCTEVGKYGLSRISLSYRLNSETEIDDIAGESLVFTIDALPVTSSLPMPSRGVLSIKWWLIGGLLIGVPLVVLVIVRLTLWKR